MFSKTDKQPPSNGRAVMPPPSMAMAMESGRGKSMKVASVISEDLIVNGGLVSEGEVHIDGKVNGDVKVAKLTLGESGVIEGSVTAETVEIRGKVIGPVTAKLVRLFSSAHVDGDITHEQLAMETGAFFQGRSLKLPRPAPAAVSAPHPLTAGVIPMQASAAG